MRDVGSLVSNERKKSSRECVTQTSLLDPSCALPENTVSVVMFSYQKFYNRTKKAKKGYVSLAYYRGKTLDILLLVANFVENTMLLQT